MSLDLLSSSDSSSKEGAYLNEMEGPSLPEANSIIYPPTPGYHLYPGSEVKVVTSVTTSQMDARSATERNRQERMGNIG